MTKLKDQLLKSLIDEISSHRLFSEAEQFYASNEKISETMFGYPSNNVCLSAATQYYLMLHYTSPFSNNCGDIDERGNYVMDTKATEKKIVALFAEKFGMGEKFWGYVTSGGTESNSCGINMAFNKYPDGKLYFSRSAHYSVLKHAKGFDHEQIPTVGHDKIDLDALFSTIKKDVAARLRPINLVLTHGTTMYGECDPVDEIVAFLNANRLEHYVHIDAAHFGGIPNNQKNAPVLTDLKARGVDSVCVSMHKYIGFPDVKSVFVATTRPVFPKVDYIGQHDTTVSGSRSIPAFALLNHVTERLAVTDENEYYRNVSVFYQLLTDAKVPFYQADKSNVFVIDRPKGEVCRRFQLSCFKETENGKEVDKAHIMIFPHHKKENMLALVNALKSKG